MLVAAAGAFALAALPAIAQDYDDGEDDIVVEASGVVRERTGRRSSSGIPIDELTVQCLVTSSDLDLRYDADIDELYRRIDYTVREACNEIERASQGVPITSERECVREARRDAMGQAEALIYARRG